MAPSRVALIVGAGWSAAAGYPLARDLIAGPVYVANEAARERAQAVLDSFAAWRTLEPDRPSEVFLAEVLAGKVRRPVNDDAPSLFDAVGGPPLPWSSAVETVMLRLALPVLVDGDDPRSSQALVYAERHSNRLRYSGNLTSPARSTRHVAFIRDVVRRHRLTGVVTTNYDTLVERVLRHRPMRRFPEPGFHYGGLPRPQRAHGHLPWDRFDPYFVGKPGDVELTGTVPVCKLHGSLNWERDGRAIALFRDQRLVYRRGGTAAIIPPTAEKQAESWLSSVWETAENLLANSEKWIVVGYSLPAYDHAVRDLLRHSAASGHVGSVLLRDPFAAELAPQWRDVTALPVEVEAGL